MAKSLESSSIDSFMEFFSIDKYFLSRKGEITEDQKKSPTLSVNTGHLPRFLKNSAAEIIFTPAVSLQCAYCILTMTNDTDAAMHDMNLIYIYTC